jgi:hypothetical protein
MKLNHAILTIAAAACLLVPIQGLALGSSQKSIVRLSDSGRIYVGETYTGLKKLVAMLKSKGYKPEHAITVEIPKNTSQKALKAIRHELMRKGYGKVRFRKPQVIKAERGPDPFLRNTKK